VWGTTCSRRSDPANRPYEADRQLPLVNVNTFMLRTQMQSVIQLNGLSCSAYGSKVLLGVHIQHLTAE
jgi:hypothetical protein